jgi:hypothetical protein
MFSAIRRGRREPARQRSPSRRQNGDSLARRCRRGIESASQLGAAIRDELEAKVAQAVGQWHHAPGAQRPLLLASLAASGGEPVAFMPSKNRAAKAALNSAGDAAPAGDEGAGGAAAAPPPPSSGDEEAERILISEVRLAVHS